MTVSMLTIFKSLSPSAASSSESESMISNRMSGVQSSSLSTLASGVGLSTSSTLISMTSGELGNAGDKLSVGTGDSGGVSGKSGL